MKKFFNKLLPSWIDEDMGLKWNLKRFWNKITRPFYFFFRWAIKSFQYSIFLWNDYDWDKLYIMRLLQYKLKRTRKAISSNNIILRSEEVAAQIKHAECLIQNWIDDDFESQLFEAHNKKWGKTKSFSKEVKVGNKTYHQFEITREKTTTEDLKKQEAKEYREIITKAALAREKNADLLFAHIRKYIDEWWD